MKRPKTFQLLLSLAAVAAWAAGCATQNINPPQARVNTGYVDFHPDLTNELCWDVARFDQSKGDFKRAFSSLEPPEGGILRLAFTPGHYKLRVTFLNLPISKPADFEVDVQDGKITPVHVVLTDAGNTVITDKRVSVGSTAYGRYGRRTKFDTEDSDIFSVSAKVEDSIPYRVKEQTAYKR
jgi:hypothetical protein